MALAIRTKSVGLCPGFVSRLPQTVGILLLFLAANLWTLTAASAQEPTRVLKDEQPLLLAPQEHNEGQGVVALPSSKSPEGSPLLINSTAPTSPSQQAFSLYLEGSLAFQQGNLSRALTALRQAITFDNSSSFLWTALAVLYWEGGEIALAEDSLARAKAQGGGSYELLMLQGLLHLRKEEFAPALQALESASALNPQEPRAKEILGVLYAQKGECERAIAVLNKLLELTPANLDARLLRARCFASQQNFTNAVKDLREIIAQSPQEPFYEELARIFMVQGNANQEIAIYQEALLLFPNSCQMRWNLAQKLAANGNYSSAQEVLWNKDCATVWCPGFEEPLASLYSQAGDYQRAVALFEGVIQAKLATGKQADGRDGAPADREYYFLGLAYEGLNDVEMALKAYANVQPSSSFAPITRLREARILATNAQKPAAIAKLESILPAAALPEAYLFLAKLYSEQGNWTLAESTLRNALVNHKDNVDILYGLGFLLEHTGRHKEAIGAMRKLLSLSANHTEALNFIGYSYAERGVNLREAQNLIAKALTQDPLNGQILDSMGWIFFQQKRYKEAQKYLEKAQRLLPEEPLIAKHLAQTYEKTGDSQKAKKIYLKLLQQKPRDDEQLHQKSKTSENKLLKKQTHKKISSKKKRKQATDTGGQKLPNKPREPKTTRPPVLL